MKTIPVIILLILFSFSGLSIAQMGEHDKNQNRLNSQNIEKMNNIMNKMSNSLSKGTMTPEQQKVCADMMNRMGKIMMEMTGDYGEHMSSKHHKQLEEIEKEWLPFDNSDKN